MEIGADWATAGEDPTIGGLRAAAREEAEPKRGGAVLVATPEPAAHNWRIGMGTIDGVAVGYVRLRTDELTDGRRVVHIGELFVLPAARSVGVGEALMALVTNWAREAGLDGVESVALPGDRETKNFFESHGMVARAITVFRDLTQ